MTNMLPFVAPEVDPFTFVDSTYLDPLPHDEPMEPQVLCIDVQGMSTLIVDRDADFCTVVVFKPTRATKARVKNYEGWDVRLNLVDAGGTFSNDRVYTIHSSVMDVRTSTLRVRVEVRS